MDSANGGAPETAIASPAADAVQPSRGAFVRALRRPLVRVALQVGVLLVVTLACYLLSR